MYFLNIPDSVVFLKVLYVRFLLALEPQLVRPKQRGVLAKHRPHPLTRFGVCAGETPWGVPRGTKSKWRNVSPRVMTWVHKGSKEDGYLSSYFIGRNIDFYITAFGILLLVFLVLVFSLSLSVEKMYSVKRHLRLVRHVCQWRRFRGYWRPCRNNTMFKKRPEVVLTAFTDKSTLSSNQD